MKVASIPMSIPGRPGTAPQGPANGDVPQIGAARQTVADSIRAVGAGFAQATELNGVVTDKAYIHPIESAYAAGRAVGKYTQKVPKLHKVTNLLFSGTAFITAFHGMIMGGVLRSPGNVARDVANSIADRIDGQQTLDGDFGFGLNTVATTALAKSNPTPPTGPARG